MPQTLKDIIKSQKAQGKTAIEIHKWLRDNNMSIPWMETQKIFNQV